MIRCKTLAECNAVEGVVYVDADNLIAYQARDVLPVHRQPNVVLEKIAGLEARVGMERWQRDVVFATLPADHPQRVRAQAVEDEIAALRPQVQS